MTIRSKSDRLSSATTSLICQRAGNVRLGLVRDQPQHAVKTDGIRTDGEQAFHASSRLPHEALAKGGAIVGMTFAHPSNMNKKSQYETLTEFAGWVGVLSILLAYALLSFEVLASDQATYHILNLVGGTGIVIDAVADKNYQPAVLNLIWAAIAVYAISRVVA